MTALALPTRRDEAWRYSDLDALASVWPVPDATRITVTAGQSAHGHLLQDAAPGAAAGAGCGASSSVGGVRGARGTPSAAVGAAGRRPRGR